jgi:hypothetical protein
MDLTLNFAKRLKIRMAARVDAMAFYFLHSRRADFSEACRFVSSCCSKIPSGKIRMVSSD